MQHRRSCRHGLHQSARCIAGTCARAGDDHAELAADARRRIGHVAGPGFTPRGNKANLSQTMEGVQHGHVVDGNHAKSQAHALRLQKAGDDFTRVDGGGAHISSQ